MSNKVKKLCLHLHRNILIGFLTLLVLKQIKMLERMRHGNQSIGDDLVNIIGKKMSLWIVNKPKRFQEFLICK